jgi:dTDP-4-amino-4,6-dideoxygalactose transaminase
VAVLRISSELPFLANGWNPEIYGSMTASLASGEIVRGPELEALEDALGRMFPGFGAVLCGSGSLALEIALGGLGITAGDDVLVPSFCCSAVLRPIIAVGAVPVFADVGLELNLTAATAEAALTKKTRAIIVPHLFGNPADVAGILDFARRKSIGVVDDAAQALGASVNDRLAGALGDVGVLSFGREKVCSGLGGGVLLVPERLASRVCDNQLQNPSCSRVLRLVVSTLLWNYRRRLSSPLACALTALRKPPHQLPRRYKKEGMANLNAAVARSLLQSLPENLSKRRARVQLYQKLLGCDARLQLIAHAEGSACLTQVARVLPVRDGHDRAARVVAALKRSGCYVHGSYIPLHVLANFKKFQRRRPAYADRIWHELIELPCDPELDMNEIARIAQTLQRAL